MEQWANGWSPVAANERRPCLFFSRTCQLVKVLFAGTMQVCTTAPAMWAGLGPDSPQKNRRKTVARPADRASNRPVWVPRRHYGAGVWQEDIRRSEENKNFRYGGRAVLTP